ncbi:hypothetical protein ACFL7D_08370, partial [candidate division KSB1 bacterium]
PLDSCVETQPCQIKIKKWFTDIETVKKMYTAITRSLSIQNEEEILVGYFESELDFGNIIENSERVKIKERALGPDLITFTDGLFQSLSNDDLVKGTVVVTNESEDIEWIEGVDFEVDYTSGKIRHIFSSDKSGTASGSGTGTGSDINSASLSLMVEKTIKVHYEYYSTKIKDFDYSINYVRGSLSRKDGGTLVSGSKIFVDYKVRELVQDEVIALSIDQAHVWIISRVGIEYEASPNESLKYGEAYFALYLIAKMSAANLIYEKRNDDVEEAAKELNKISDDHQKLALSYLRDYIKFPAAKRSAKSIRNNSLIC